MRSWSETTREPTDLDGVLEREGCGIRFVDSGSDGGSPPVVLLHGSGLDHHMFDAQYEALVSAGHRVVSWDMRGHGASRPNHSRFTAELALSDLAALVDHLGLSRPALVGLSIGGNLAQAAIRRSLVDASALAVLGATWNAGPLTSVERALLRLAAPSLHLIPARAMPRLMAGASAVTPEARRDAARAFGQLSKREFIEVFRAATSLVDPDADYRTPVPLCLIRGEHDATGNIATAMRRWAEAEGVVEHVIPGAGHVVTQDAPAEVTEILLDFLR